MATLVSDANIFIDLDVADLTRALFRLDDEIVTPDVLYQEELAEHHSELPALGLRVESLSPAGVEEMMRLRAMYSRPGTNDLLALALALSNRWTLVTGDADLRDVAQTELVVVHGTLWLVERMVRERVIPVRRAEAGFKRMRSDGRRLPWPMVEELLERLR